MAEKFGFEFCKFAAALGVYVRRKYLQLRRSGCLYSCLEQLYQYGRLLNFSPPALPLKDFLESPKEQKEITENKFPNNSSFPR